MEHSSIESLFETLSTNLDLFIQTVHTKQSEIMVTDQWTVKEVLCHIVFWHESYAANYQALSLNREPPLLVGPGYRLNTDGVAKLRHCSQKELIERLQQANKTLYECIVGKKVPQMTYKKDGRVYKTEEFIDLVARHLQTHTKQIKKTK